MNNKIKKLIGLCFVASLVAVTTPAEATCWRHGNHVVCSGHHYRHHHHHHHYHCKWVRGHWHHGHWIKAHKVCWN